MEQILAVVPLGKAVQSRSIISDKDFERSTHCQNVFRPNGNFYALCTQFERASGQALHIGRTQMKSMMGENGTWIHCHGLPGSRYELLHLTEELCAAGLRIIVADRPGYGDSTPCPDYGFAQYTSDLCQLADETWREYGWLGRA